MKILIGLLLAAAPMVADEQNAESRTRQLIRLAPLLSAVDLDRDGSVSAAEIRKAMASIRTIDRNGDGAIQPEERALNAALLYQPAVRDDNDDDRRGDDDDHDDDRRDGRPDSGERRDIRPERDGRPKDGAPRGDRPDDDRGPRDRGPDGHRPDTDRGDREHRPEMKRPEHNGRGPDDRRGPDGDRRDDGDRGEGRERRGDGPEGRGPGHDAGAEIQRGPQGERGPKGELGPRGPESQDARHRGPSFGGKPSFDRGFGPKPGFGMGPRFGMGHGFGPRPGMMGHRPGMMDHPRHLAQNERKDGDQQLQLRREPGMPPLIAQKPQPHQIQGMKVQAAGGSAGVIGLLFRLLDSDHNGSLSFGEFQRIAGALNGPAAPQAGPQPSLHSAGPRLLQRPEIAHRPEGPKGAPGPGPKLQAPGVHSQPEHRRPELLHPQPGDHPPGHRPEKAEPKKDAPEKSGHHPKVEELRPDNRPGRDEGRPDERGRRGRGPGSRDRARPTEAPLMSLESDWI